MLFVMAANCKQIKGKANCGPSVPVIKRNQPLMYAMPLHRVRSYLHSVPEKTGLEGQGTEHRSPGVGIEKAIHREDTAQRILGGDGTDLS